MFRTLLQFLLCLYILVSSEDSHCKIKACCTDAGYYWRDYKGSIPSDAILGGHDSEGDSTYVGQVLHTVEPHLLPGEIRPKERLIHYEMRGVFATNRNVKILCSQHPNQYEWVPASIKDMQDLEKQKQLVQGGFEGDTLYVGRAPHDSEVIVGKIVFKIKEEEYRAMYAAHKGKEAKFTTFEVLAYNPYYVSSENKSNDSNRNVLNFINVNIFNN